MNTRKKYIEVVFLIVILLITSCQRINDSNIKSDIGTVSFYENFSEKIPFSSFVDTIELIPLETTDENMIGEITRIIFSDLYYCGLK